MGRAGERTGELGSFKSRPRSEGRSHDARRGWQLQQRRARAVPSCAGTRTALTGGAERSAFAGKGAAAVAARPFGWAGPAAVLGRAAREGWRLALGYGGKLGWRGEERKPAGRNSRREGENDSFLFLFLHFSKSIFKFKFQFFLKSLINSKHSPNDMQQHVCITCS